MFFFSEVKIVKFADLIKRDLVSTQLVSDKKEAVIREIIGRIAHVKKIKNTDVIIKKLLKREKESSTGLESGVAIPHCRMEGLKEAVLFVGISKKGIDFQSIDHKPAHLFFLFITPLGETATHLKILSRIALS